MGQTAEVDVLRPQIADLSARAQKLLREQDEMIWKHWTEGAAIDIGKTYQGNEDLFAPAAIQKIDRFRNLALPALDKRAATHLLVHFIGEYLSKSLADETEALANLESSVSFTYGGKEIPLRNLDRAISNEKTRAKREALYAAATPAVERFAPLVRIRRERADEVLKALGYSYTAYASLVREADFSEVAMLAGNFLSRSEALYRKSLTEIAKRELLGNVSNLRRVDLIKLQHINRLDAPYGKDLLLDRVRKTASGLSFDLSTLPNVRLDLSENPAKNSQPLCLALSVPSDIRLSVRPAGGQRIFAAAFHELGHLLHFSTSQQTRFEMTKLGNPSLNEALALLFESLVRDQQWLGANLSVPKEKMSDLVLAARFERLFNLRVAAAHALYEIGLRREPSEGPKAVFQTLFSRALGISLNADESARYLVEQEDLYSSVDSFRAGIFAAQLEARLISKFGSTWWKSSEAGQFLRNFWAGANADSLEDAIKKLGDSELSIMAAIEKLEAPAHPSPDPTAPDAGVP